ncbi:MAG: fused MFS/spermidine synthase [Algiphilus sp.]|uniref:fused MFS/spermidine synthase n=1 Tax=Algiphilus sp. TaxID=1872431 RepID=UPI0032EB7291
MVRDGLAFLIFFVSGFAALVYQVLWLRELGLLFGNTAEAAATVIAVFFAGIAAGGAYWGARVGRHRSPLRSFGILELCVAVTALLHFVLVHAYHAIYPLLYAVVGESAALTTLLKLILAFVVLFPPAFFMGGTLPAMGQHLIRSPARLGPTGSLLYAVNTLGGMSGAFAGAFVLPLTMDIDHVYLFAVGLDALVGLCALMLAARTRQAVPARPANTTYPDRPPTPSKAAAPLPGALVALLAFASGAAALAVEVLWTRMFAQVLHNSVYTYSVVLILFLAALAFGSLLASILARTRLAPAPIVAALLTATGVAVGASPWLFATLTGGLNYVGGGDEGFGRYIAIVFAKAAVVVLPAGVLLGTVLPYLLRILQGRGTTAGATIGRLVAVNTVGGILGAVGAGFLLLAWLGLWAALVAIAVGYLALAGAVLLATPLAPRWTVAAPVTLAGLMLFLALHMLPDRIRNFRGETLVELREGSHATAAVVRRDGHKLIRVNNFYRLGGTGAMASERNQGRIPLMLHPNPRSVFFLGLGTGITAGAAMEFDLARIDICEILPEVVYLARRHFNDAAQGLYDDPRTDIRVEDGRNCLAARPRQYDVIISDLFTPWKAGTGNLYTVEHYELARERLHPGGLFAQWLPMYQLDRADFDIIVRSMLEAFPRVVLWRGDMFASAPILAVVGYPDAHATIDPDALRGHGLALAGRDDLPADAVEAAALRFYVGNLSSSASLFADAPANHDDRPVIEYLSPQRHGGDRGSRFVGMPLARFYEALATQTPPARDPYLQALDDTQRGYVTAGLSYYRYVALQHEGHFEAAEVFLNDFLARTPFELPPAVNRRDAPASQWDFTTR